MIRADASKVTGAQFFDAVTGSSPEKREEKRQLLLKQCMAAIQRGDTYGWPPALVAEAREMIEASVCGDPLLGKAA